MRLRSALKIERLVDARYPNAYPFRAEGYEELSKEYRSACKAWERYRDSICPATTATDYRPCICDKDSRLVNHPLRLNFQQLVKRVNELDREAYDKLVIARKALSAVYHRVNELKNKS